MAEFRNDIHDRAWQEAFDWTTKLENRPDDEALTAAFRRWLAEDPAHVEAYEHVQRIWTAARHLTPTFDDRWRHVPAPASLAASATGPAFPAAYRRQRTTVSRRQWIVGAGALAAGLSLYAVTGGFRDIFSDYATGTGETRTVVLTDGTRVQLDTDTAVRVAYGPDGRKLTLLHGRVFLEVTRDAARPFAVAAGPARVEVLGTRFEIGLDASTVSVGVEEGHVAVSMNGRSVAPRNGLRYGETVSIDLETGAARLAAANPETIAAWRHGRLIVVDRTIAQTLHEIGRYHRGVILLRDEGFGLQRVSGVYDLHRPEDAVRLVAEAHGGRATRISPWVIVVSGR